MYFFLFCEDYPRVKVGPENPLRVEKGTPAKLTCNVDSKPAVSSVKWTRNGRFSETSFTYTIPQVSIQVCLLRRRIRKKYKYVRIYIRCSSRLLQIGNFSRYYCYYCYCCSDYHCLLLYFLVPLIQSNPKWKTTCFQMFKFSCHCSLCNAIK